MIALDTLWIGVRTTFTYTNKKGETKIVTGTVTDITDTRVGIRVWVWDGKTEWKGEPMAKQYDPQMASNVRIGQ